MCSQFLFQLLELPHEPGRKDNYNQGCHGNLIINSMTIYPVIHDARMANADLCAYSTHTRNESNISFQTENKEAKRWFTSKILPNITIWNLERNPKASNSQKKSLQ